MKIVIDTDEIEVLKKQAGEIVISPKGEQPIIKLLQLQELIEKALDEAKLIVETKALALNTNLKTIHSDHIKVYYRAYGSKYAIDESLVHLVPRNLYKAEIGIELDEKLPQDIMDGLKNLGAKVKETTTKGVTKKDIKFVPIPKEVDKYIDEYKGQMPAGIVEPERKKSLTFRIKGEDDRPEVG